MDCENECVSLVRVWTHGFYQTPCKVLILHWRVHQLFMLGVGIQVRTWTWLGLKYDFYQKWTWLEYSKMWWTWTWLELTFFQMNLDLSKKKKQVPSCWGKKSMCLVAKEKKQVPLCRGKKVSGKSVPDTPPQWLMVHPLSNFCCMLYPVKLHLLTQCLRR